MTRSISSIYSIVIVLLHIFKILNDVVYYNVNNYLDTYLF